MSISPEEQLIDNSVDLIDILKEAKKKWYIYAISLAIFIALAYFYNNTAVKKYKVLSTILMHIKSENSRDNSDFLSTNSLNYFGRGTTLSNELLTLGSTPLIRKAIKNIDWKVSYYEKQFINYGNIYGFSPFKVVINEQHPQIIDTQIKLKFIDENTFWIQTENSDVNIYDYSIDKTIGKTAEIRIDTIGEVGQIMEGDNYSFIILFEEDKFEPNIKEKDFAFNLNGLAQLSSQIKTELTITPYDVESSVINIEINHSSARLAMDLIKGLTNEYMKSNLEKKNHAALQTINYIDRQIGNIKDSLNITESKLQNFRITHQIVDLETKSRTAQDQLQTLLNDRATLEGQIEYYNYLGEYFKNNSRKTSDLIAPATMGFDNPLLTSLIQELLACNSELNTLKEKNQQRSPRYQTLTIRAENLNKSINENIKNISNSSELTLNNLNSRINSLRSEIQKLPGTSRKLSGLERKYNVDNEIYTFLLQRRAESEIARASSLPDNEIIEPATIIGVAEPKTNFIYLAAILLSLLLPSIPVLANTLFNTRIMNKSELKRIKNVFFAGGVFHKPDSSSDLIFKDYPGSIVAESVRSVCSNLDLLNPNSHRQVFLVTSSYTGEGKSFFATNLAYALANSNKKVALVDFDLRRPTIHKKLNYDQKLPGVTEFLTGQENFETIINRSDYKKLDFVFSGKLPPNPNELVISEETEKLYNQLRDRYDYIVIDTPPIGIVSDVNHLLKLSDIAIFVVRQNFTSIHGFEQAISDAIKRFPGKITTILNDYKYARSNSDFYSYKSYKNYYGGTKIKNRKSLRLKTQK